MRTKSAMCATFFAVTFLAMPDHCRAEPMSIYGSHTAPEGSLPGWRQLLGSNAPDTGAPARWAPLSTEGDLLGAEQIRSLGGIVGFGGRLGVVMDTSGDLPRMRGLSFSPTDSMRIEASGIVEENMRNIGGRLSVRFSF